MVFCDEMNEIAQEEGKISAKKRLLYEQRKYEIGNLAEQYGILSLPNEEIRLAFQNLINNHYQK